MSAVNIKVTTHGYFQIVKYLFTVDYKPDKLKTFSLL
jgi:hypothetical protein